MKTQFAFAALAVILSGCASDAVGSSEEDLTGKEFAVSVAGVYEDSTKSDVLVLKSNGSYLRVNEAMLLNTDFPYEEGTFRISGSDKKAKLSLRGPDLNPSPDAPPNISEYEVIVTRNKKHVAETLAFGRLPKISGVKQTTGAWKRRATETYCYEDSHCAGQPVAASVDPKKVTCLIETKACGIRTKEKPVCKAVPACDSDDKKEASEALCKSAKGRICYKQAACGQTVWCSTPDVPCGKFDINCANK